MGKSRSRKYRRYLRGNIVETEALGALAISTGKKQAFTGVVKESTWVSSVKATYSLANFTAGINKGPVVVYLCHSGYSLAEIEEYIEASGAASWDEGDLATKEIMSRGRMIKKVGSFQPGSNHQPADMLKMSSRPITTKLGFLLLTGQTVAVVYYNMGGDALTTGSDAEILGHANLWPQG